MEDEKLADKLLDRILMVLMPYDQIDVERIKAKLTVVLDDYQICPKQEALVVYTEGKNDYYLRKFLLAKAVAGRQERTLYINAKAFVAVKNYLADRKDTNPYLFPREINTKDRTMISNFSRKDWFKDPRLVTKADHFGRDSVNNMVRTIGKRAGVNGVHTHRFRRTCATQALRHGMPIELVSMMLGHEQISTTQIYLDIRDDDLQAAHRKYVV